jgi:DMSO reductase anchor subunit
MSVTILRLLIDFGLLVLIWIVQRIVYPGFLYYNTKDLINWHRTYTSRFTFIVMPLMLGQLGISIYQLITEIDLYTVMSLIIIILIWLSTFLQFVPIHAKISKGKVSQKMLNSLVKKNWIRTFLWTALFLYSMLVTYIKI